MAYQALYRQWRPKAFEDIVGQLHIVTTLKNQIKNGNISHAYLFSGTRGTGKTSTAKIFARAVNCIQTEDLNPCNKCEVCEGILSDSIMDVIEIDAASNNGVDHIREIRESVKYPPSKGKYKVYIIDEVHMLSTGAFNALLKTLEEPPKHIIFILATTEPHKLPATILSRCQRFDFKPVRLKDIVEHLKRICTAIGISFEDKALGIIARNGNGSIRDSLSILEQCISFSRGELTYSLVVETLGITKEDLLWGLTEAIIRKNTPEALGLVQHVVKEGKDVHQLIKDLIVYFHSLMHSKLKSSYGEEEFTEELQERLRLQSDSIGINEIVELIYSLSEADSKAKYASQPQIILEVAIVALCNRTSSQPEAILDRLNKLEAAIYRGNLNYSKKSNSSIAYQDKGKNTVRTEKNMATTSDNCIEGSFTTAVAAVVEEGAPPNFDQVRDKWEEILEVMRQDKKAQIKAFLKEGNLLYIKGKNLVIAFKEGFGFHREALDKDKTKEYINSAIMKVTGQNLGLSLVMESEMDAGARKAAEDESLERLKEIVPEGILEVVGD